MSISARLTVGGVKWICYQHSNAFTGHGATNLEGTCAEEWDVLAKSRSKVSPEEAQILCNADAVCQGFTFDQKDQIYWKLTDVNPARFKKKSQGLAVYVKEEAVKANAARKRNEYVQKQMLSQFDKYSGTEKWIEYEFSNAYTGFGAINMEGSIAEEWDAVACSRPRATLARAKEQCDADPECHGFTYDPDHERYWKVKEVDPRRFKKAIGFHVYVKHSALVLVQNKMKALAEKQHRERLALMEEATMLAHEESMMQYAASIGGMHPAMAAAFDGGYDPSGKGWGKGDGGFVAPPFAKSSFDAAPTPQMGPGGQLVERQFAKAGAAAPSAPPPPAAPAAQGDKGKGKATPPPAKLSEFDNRGQLGAAASVKKPGETSQKAAGVPFKPRKKVHPRTPSTITLHGRGFMNSGFKEDRVLAECQELAFIEGFLWPDYATIVEDNLCCVEWPDAEIAVTFYEASGGILMIENKKFTVKPPLKEEDLQRKVAPDPAKGEEALPEGSRVAIQNLTGAKELNGKFAHILIFNESTGRYVVTLESDEKTQKSLKPDNLKPLGGPLAVAKAKAAPKPQRTTILEEGTKVLIDGMTGKDFFEVGATDMNGKTAIVKGYDKEKGRYMIELEEQKDIVYSKLKPEHLTSLDETLSELEQRKKRALGLGAGTGRNSVDVQDALKGVNGDMWANFLNMYTTNEPEQKRAKGP